MGHGGRERNAERERHSDQLALERHNPNLLCEYTTAQRRETKTTDYAEREDRKE